MTTLYVTQPGSVIRYETGALTVWAEEDIEEDDAPRRRRKLAAIEPHRLDGVVMLGRVHITANAMRLCCANQIPVSLLDAGGNLAARLVPPEARNADVRLYQYRQHDNAEERLIRARLVIAAKLGNAAAVLRTVRSNYPSTALAQATRALEQTAERAKQASELASLLGIEGTGARHYFTGLATAFRGDIPFEGRAQRPPPDPANAMLSFGYVLLANRLAGLIEARGADPCLGFFHELRPGRHSLALDLLEEFRHPVVDRMVLRLCNLRKIKPADFEPDIDRPGGVKLTLDGRRRFLDEWEQHLAKPLREAGVPPEERLDVHRLLRRQVDRLIADFRGGEPYRPFRIEG